jgi:hypothetical protein
MLGCGAVAVLLARNLVDAPNNCYFSVIAHQFWIFVGGLFLIIALAAWATSLCNLLSNAFFGYIRIVRDIEDDLGIPYPSPQSWATTFEFLSRDAQRDLQSLKLRGNVWNIANAFLALCGMYMLIVISQIAHVGLTFYVGGLAYSAAIVLVMFVSIKSWMWASGASAIAIFFSAFVLVVGPGQWTVVSHLSPIGVSTWRDPSIRYCETATMPKGQ